jgi:DNA gyrase subunit A
MAADEHPVFCKMIHGYDQNARFVFLFENGKGVRIPVTAYETKGTRHKLSSAYSVASPLVKIFYTDKTTDLFLLSSQKNAALLKSDLIAEKVTRTSGGTSVFSLRKGEKLTYADAESQALCERAERYRKKELPKKGTALTEKDEEKLRKAGVFKHK